MSCKTCLDFRLFWEGINTSQVVQNFQRLLDILGKFKEREREREREWFFSGSRLSIAILTKTALVIVSTDATATPKPWVLRPQRFIRLKRCGLSTIRLQSGCHQEGVQTNLQNIKGVLGSIPGLATYFRFSFRFIKKGSCQLLAKVCARSTG